MGMGCTRVVERVLATTGKFSGVPAVFKPALDVPKGGVLWALPALIATGLLRHTHHHFALPKGFYGTTHIFLLLAFMALSRIKSNEKLRYKSAGESGILHQILVNLAFLLFLFLLYSPCVVLLFFCCLPHYNKCGGRLHF
jgi:hypothetical protein